MEDVNRARKANRNPAFEAPLPATWTFEVKNAQLLIEPSADDSPHLKALYGYVGQINDAACNDTATPLCLQIIAKLPFKYGAPKGEFKRSWAFARVDAFASKCSLADPSICFSPLNLPSHFPELKFLAAYHTAQLFNSFRSYRRR